MMMMMMMNKNRCTVCYYYYYLIILTTNYLVVLVAAFCSSSSSSSNHGAYSTSKLPLMDFHHHNHNHNHQSSLSHYYNTGSSSSCTQLFAAAASTTTTTTTTESSTVNDDMKLRILKLIEPTKRGLVTTPLQKINIEKEIRILEESLKLNEPARDIRMDGLWEVLYTTAPPPSNGKLGPFIGIANQKIDLENGTYSNILEVGGKETNNKSDKKPWLTAVLNASWEEWDGTLLEEKGNGEEKWKDAVVNVDDDDDDSKDDDNDDTNDVIIDYGATSWKVDFKTITIRLFDIPLLKQQFKEGTSRVWRMSYLDNDTRIVRAGRTGKGEDDVVFYMIRKD